MSIIASSQSPLHSQESTSQPSVIKTTCCYCGVGCGVEATVENNTVSMVTGDEAHPANLGRLCVKGSSLHETQVSADRLLQPLISGEPSDWGSALAYGAEKFKAVVEEHGPDSVAFYLSGQLLTEDYYVANKLMKGFVGTANIDTNSRLCMASAVVAHKRAFGGDIVPGTYEDLELADVLFLVGSNTAYAHPVIYQRIAKAKYERPNMKVVVIDPRRTATCDIADYHLALRPGSDAFFFNGLLGYLADNHAIDTNFIADHCDGFDDALLAAKTQVSSVAQAATLCDVSKADLLAVYQLFASTHKAVTVFSQGINQSSSGVDKGNAIINCHLATGKIGRPGATPFSITGQPNAMGGREVGGLANQLAAHMGYANQEDIDRVARFWNADNMAQKEGLKAVDMFQAVHDGKIKAIWIMATNPVVTMPDADFVKAALEKCELVMVSDCIGNTDTAKLADVVFPATTWSEKNGTVTNSERRISLQKGLLPAPGQAKHDWQIISEFAKRLGYESAFNYSHPVEIFREHAELSGLDNQPSSQTAHTPRAFNISGLKNISKEAYQNFSPIQWPVTERFPEGVERLFENGRFYTPNGRAQFVPIIARFPQMPPKDDQVIMNTGRIRDQWHTMARTGNAPKLLGHIDEPFIDIRAEDAKRLGLANQSLAVLENRGARYMGRIQYSDAQRPKEVFVPMHWNGKFSSSSRADALVNAITDPLCGQPEFKHSPVRIRAYQPLWNGFLLSDPSVTLSSRGMSATAEPNADYWVKIPVEKGTKYRIADTATPECWAAWLTEQFPAVDDWVELTDSDSEFYRSVGFVGGCLAVVLNVSMFENKPIENRWLEQQLGEECDLNSRFAVLAGVAGDGVEDEGAIVCSCFQVGEKTIQKAIAGGCSSAEALGEKLKCGSNCGSCIPELNGMIKAYSEDKNLAQEA